MPGKSQECRETNRTHEIKKDKQGKPRKRRRSSPRKEHDEKKKVAGKRGGPADLVNHASSVKMMTGRPLYVPICLSSNPHSLATLIDARFSGLIMQTKSLEPKC